MCLLCMRAESRRGGVHADQGTGGCAHHLFRTPRLAQRAAFLGQGRGSGNPKGQGHGARGFLGRKVPRPVQGAHPSPPTLVLENTVMYTFVYTFLSAVLNGELHDFVCVYIFATFIFCIPTNPTPRTLVILMYTFFVYIGSCLVTLSTH
jgi:hypothetical protein